MKSEIVRRQFTKIDDCWIEWEDLQRRGLSASRSWSSFCALLPSDKPEELAATLRKQVLVPHIDVVPSATAAGVWLLGGYSYLESALAQLRT